ncbi:MAG: hypothetical protein QOF53_3818 [Nocardioidaceae bacterium]|nr:hypothetical protein [Nocardioidaceae bacterium]
MTSGSEENLGRLDDEAEDREPSSTTDGPAAAGEYDPAQGSPGGGHPVGEAFPDEAVRYDEAQRPRAPEQDDSTE